MYEKLIFRLRSTASAYMLSLKCGLCVEAIIYLPANASIDTVFLEGNLLSVVVPDKTIEMWHQSEEFTWVHRQSFSLGAFSDVRGLGGRPIYHEGSLFLAFHLFPSLAPI
jgi:hypothetical protein